MANDKKTSGKFPSPPSASDNQRDINGLKDQLGKAFAERHSPSEPNRTAKDRLVGSAEPAPKGLHAFRIHDFGWVTIISLSINILMLTSPLYMLQIYDRVVASGSIDTLVFLSLACGGLLFANGLMEAFRSQLTNNVAARFHLTWAPRILRALAFQQEHTSGTDRSRPLKDLDVVQKFLSGNVLTALLDAPWAPIFLVALFILHPLLGMTAVGGAIALTVIAVLTELFTKKQSDEAFNEANQAHDQADQLIDNSGAVRAMGMLSELQTRWQKSFEKSARLQSGASDRAAFLRGVTKFVRPLLQMFILGFGAFLVIDGKMSAGAMVAGSILMGRALAPIEQVVSGWRSLLQARASRRRLKAFVEKHVKAEADTLTYPTPKGNVSAEAATVFVPKTHKPVLNRVEMELAPGQIVGIVGRSGAGKSTFARLMAGALSPDKGAVRMDGVELRHWSEQQRQQFVGYLPQDIQLFSGTVAENISRFQDGLDREVHDASKLAGAGDLIAALPDGFMTELSGNGSPLSPGMRQRVALARALFGRPSLVVLDEPDAHLDSEGEAALSDAIEALRDRGVTVLIVTHRSAILHHVDKILALESGQVTFFGEKSKFFHSLSAVA